MMVMVMLGASVISAFAFKMLFQKPAGDCWQPYY